MIIRQISDLHNEFITYRFAPTPIDKETTLVLCGDIDCARTKTRYADFLEYASGMFKYVVLVAGNHEFYGGNLTTTHDKIRKYITGRKLTNVFYLNNETVVLEGVAFIGATLWTNIKNPLTELIVEGAMNDYKKIRHGPEETPWARPMRVSDTTHMHYVSRGFIESESIKHNAIGHKVVVVSHHAPSEQSIPEKYLGDPCNPAYASQLDYWLMDGVIDFWMHGHIHAKSDYFIGTCRVTCNPRGYVEKLWVEHTGYDDIFHVEIK